MRVNKMKEKMPSSFGIQQRANIAMERILTLSGKIITKSSTNKSAMDK
jgi:hypothetical protein